MKKKKYLQGITFFVGTEMYGAMKKISDEREIRGLPVNAYLNSL